MKEFFKIRRFMISMSIVALVALMYVHQQVLIYQMGLSLKENQKLYSKLVDLNRISVYNVLNLKSPVNLKSRLLARNVELDMPSKWQVVRLDSPAKVIHKDVIKRGLFANLFAVSREAEASPNVNNNYVSH